MATRLTLPREQVLGDTGLPLPGAKLYFYASGTSTPKATYADAGLTVPNSNPVVADSAGRFGDIFVASGDYKVILTTGPGVTIWTADPVSGEIASGGSSTATGNLLINGDFRVNQRGLTSVADDAYALDRWYVLTQSGSLGVSLQTAQENGQAANIHLTQPDATAKRLGLAQIVEAGDSQALRGAPVAFSGRVRCSLAVPIRYVILAWTGTADVVTSDVVADWTSASYAPGGFFVGSDLVVVASGSLTPAANVWTDLPAITGVVSTGANNLIVMAWTEGTIAQTASLDLGVARLVSGQTAPVFPARALGTEIAMCQRYYAVAYLSIRGASTGISVFDAPIFLPVPMRTTPTSALSSSGTVSNVSSFAALVSGTQGGRFEATTIAAGDAYTLDNIYSFTAEL